MGFGTNFYTDIYFNRETFTNKMQVSDAIDEEKEYLSSLKNKIKLYALMTEPNKVLPEEMRGNPMFEIDRDVENLLEEYENTSIHLWKLEMLHNEWDRCHTSEGKAITYPENWKLWNKSFIDGDFIESEEFKPEEK